MSSFFSPESSPLPYVSRCLCTSVLYVTGGSMFSRCPSVCACVLGSAEASSDQLADDS